MAGEVCENCGEPAEDSAERVDLCDDCRRWEETKWEPVRQPEKC